MSKICTDLEQSRKLVELGLDTTTADMHTELIDVNGDMVSQLIAGHGDENKRNFGTLHWSLSALLELMPKIRVAAPIIVKALLEEKYYCHYQGIGTFKEVYTTTFHEEPTDAAFEMVVWLLENGYIKPIK